MSAKPFFMLCIFVSSFFVIVNLPYVKSLCILILSIEYICQDRTASIKLDLWIGTWIFKVFWTFLGCSNLHILKQYLEVAVSLGSCQN